MDLEKKGYFCIEDLVRFLNMETGTFYRNRDLTLIFKRFMAHGARLTWKDFIKQLDNKVHTNSENSVNYR